MTVQELINQLHAYNPNDLVVLSKGAMGEAGSLEVVDAGMFIGNLPWFGEVKMRPEQLTDVRRKEGFSEEDTATEANGAVPCVVLWPVD